MRNWIVILWLLPLLAACQSAPPPTAGFLQGDFAFIPYEERVQVINIADETQPKFVTEFMLPGYVARVVANGRFLYVAHASNAPSWESQDGPPDAGLQIVDVSTPAQPTMLGHFYPKSFPTDLLLYDDLLYLATWDSIHILDVSNPDAPRGLGTFSEGATGLARQGDRLAASWGGCNFRSGYCEGGINIFNLADRQRPSPLSRLQFEELPGYDVALTEDNAVVTGKGVSVLNLADLETLVINGRFALDNGWLYAAKVLLDGDLAYTTQHDGLYILDLSQPSEPDAIGIYPTDDPLTDLALRNGRLYLANWNGLLILDITDPTFPNLLGTYNITAPAPPLPLPTATP
ncbi:MAG: hypothetical protein R3D55_06110 [Chloroflexota bacterium]